MANPLLSQFGSAITIAPSTRQTLTNSSDAPSAIPTGVPGVAPVPADVPREWANVPFAPGQPMEPWYGQVNYKTQVKQEEPRTFDYVPSVNVTISPRIPYGLTPFSQLLYYAENVPEVAMCIRMLTEMLKVMKPVIKDENNEPTDLEDLSWMTTYPDRYTAWPTWLSRFLFNTLAYDAASLYKIRDDDKKVQGLRIIDGSTIMVTIDQRGEQPAPPAPAFTQIIHGTPFLWLSTDQLWYRPRQARAYAPYGRTPVEDAMRAVQYLDNLWSYETAQYTEGTVPEMVMTAPADWAPAQVLAFEQSFNARMAGNSTEKRRIRMLPAGFGKVETKVAPWNKEGYQTALERVSYMFGLPQSEIGKAPGAGLGGKGFQEEGTQQYYRQGIGPLKEFVEMPFNDVLRENGYTKYRFELTVDTAEIDNQKSNDIATSDWTAGIITRNEARDKKNYPPIEGEKGDEFNVKTPPTGGSGGEDGSVSGQEKPSQAGQAEDAPTVAAPKQAPAQNTAKFVKVHFPLLNLLKHCGVCEEDDAYYGAPVSEVVTAAFPHQGANETDIVALSPRGLESRPAVFKPQSGEKGELVTWVGGPQCFREEAAYIFDRTLEYYLVPVTYVTEVNGKLGAVQHFVVGSSEALYPPEQYYASAWVERGAVFDLATRQLDRKGHNWLTHPDDPTRMVFIDNGLTFPTVLDDDIHAPGSAFVTALLGKPISPDNLMALDYVIQKKSMWRDLTDLVGPAAVDIAQRQIALMLQTKTFTILGADNA